MCEAMGECGGGGGWGGDRGKGRVGERREGEGVVRGIKMFGRKHFTAGVSPKNHKKNFSGNTNKQTNRQTTSPALSSRPSLSPLSSPSAHLSYPGFARPSPWRWDKGSRKWESVRGGGPVCVRWGALMKVRKITLTASSPDF